MSETVSTAGASAPASRFVGVVESIRPLTPEIRNIRIALREPAEIRFRPGQTIRLKIPTPAGQKELFRMYSLANPPQDSCAVELCVRRVPGGVGTGWIFNQLAVGDEVCFFGPYGRFGLSDSSMPMVWVAGGSGISPFWSMLRYMKECGMSRKCRLFLGAATQEHLPLLDEMRRFEKQCSWFQFTPAVAQPDGTVPWDGHVGLLPEVIDKEVGHGTGMEAYLCGPPALIESSLGVLASKGIQSDRIFMDKFIPAKPAS
jgi:ferredoxin-NADP reductase